MKQKTELILSIAILVFFTTIFSPLVVIGVKASATIFTVGCLTIPVASGLLVIRNLIVLRR